MISESLAPSPSLLRSTNGERYAQDYSTELCYVGKSDVGLGVFANRGIGRGETILKFWGPIIDFAETKRRGPKECMAIQIGENYYIDTQPPGVFVNHSCEPNAGIRDDSSRCCGW